MVGFLSFGFLPYLVCASEVTVDVHQGISECISSCAGGQVLPGPLSCASSAMRAVPFLPQGVVRRGYRRPLSPPGSGCRCHGCAGFRLRNGLFLCPLSSVHSCCRSVSSLKSTLLSSWWEGEDMAIALILAGLLLRGSCPSVPRLLPPVLCGGGAGPGFTRACSPRHITAY